jgi:hypothetical protein
MEKMVSLFEVLKDVGLRRGLYILAKQLLFGWLGEWLFAWCKKWRATEVGFTARHSVLRRRFPYH